MTKKLFGKFAAMLMTLVMSAVLFAQKGYEPIRGMGVEAYPVNNFGICLGCYNGSMSAVVDADPDNKVSMGSFATLVSGNGIAVKNTNTMYPAGYITGFNVDLGTSPITIDLLSSLRISTYKNGVLQETSASGSLLSIPLFGGTKNRIFLNLRTTKEFNEVRLYQTNVLAIFSALNVYYAFAFDPAKVPVENNAACDDIIAGSGVDGNVSGSSSFLAPLSFVHNKENIGDGNKNTYGSIVLPVGVLGSYSVGVLDKNQVYPAGNRAGFVIDPDDQGKFLSVEILKNITIETYLFGQLQDSRALSDGGGLINIKLLSYGTGRQKLSLTTTKPFNEVRLRLTQTVGVNLGALKVYYAFEEPVGCECDDKIQATGSSIPGNIVNGFGWTQSGLGLLTPSLTNPGSVVDNDPASYARLTFPLLGTFLFSGSLTVGTNSMLPANTVAGYTVEKTGGLIGVSVLDAVTVQFYNGNKLTDTFTSGSLVTGNLFTSGSNRFYIGGKSTKPFNRIKVTFSSLLSVNLLQGYNIYNAFASKDDDNDGVPNCFDKCPNGDDSVDLNGNGIPDCAETGAGSCTAVNDKSPILDTDGDGIIDACDMDSDNDGIPDALEDSNKNGKFEDDDNEGDVLLVNVLGDSVSNYLDLDSDNDGILDLFESGIPASVISQIDKDRNGVIDADVPGGFGKNGIADILETSPDSGALKYPLRNLDGDDKPDYLDITSNGSTFDLYAIGKANLDTLGGGFISIINDSDKDGIQSVVDTDLVKRGAPNSPLSPYATFLKNGSATTAKVIASDVTEVANDVKVYPNPVKAGENLMITSAEEGVYTLFSTEGKVVKSDKFSARTGIDTSSLPTGVYIIKIETKSTVKSYKVIVK